MDRPDAQPPQHPQDNDDAIPRLIAFGMSADAARIYASFMHGGRWPRPSDD
jgi:hypothetical protein